jgi:hypothetical protein
MIALVESGKIFLLLRGKNCAGKEQVVQIICPNCNATYNIRENRIPPGKKGSAVCKKCSHKMIIQVQDQYSMSTEHVTEGQSNPPAPPVPEDLHSHVPDDGLFETNLLNEYPRLHELFLEKYDLEGVFFQDKKGGNWGRRNKGIARILISIHALLEKILKDGEMVKKVCWGTAYYPFEVFLGNGFLTMFYNRYCIVGTDQRLLFINVNYRMNKPSHYLFQLQFQDIKKIKRGIFGVSLTFYKMQGKRRHFMGVKSYLSKSLHGFVMKKREAAALAEHTRREPENLCPVCFSPLERGLVRCMHCWAGFKRPRKALLRSLLLPGLGDFYLGHSFLGVLEMTGSGLVWLLLVSSVLSGAAANMVVAGVILLWVNGFDGVLTYHMAKKGYMLEHKKGESPSSASSTGRFEGKPGMLAESV